MESRSEERARLAHDARAVESCHGTGAQGPKGEGVAVWRSLPSLSPQCVGDIFISFGIKLNRTGIKNKGNVDV